MENWEWIFENDLIQEPQSSYQKKKNPLLDKSYQFALKIIKAGQYLQERKEFILSRQVVRSGTAIGALSEEAQQAESRADFIHKLSIANKEAHETHYWLRLLKDSDWLPEDTCGQLLESSKELKRLLVAIIKKAKQNK